MFDQEQRLQEEAYEEGLAWELWVIRLTKIFKDHGLPIGARNDSDSEKSFLPSFDLFRVFNDTW